MILLNPFIINPSLLGAWVKFPGLEIAAHCLKPASTSGIVQESNFRTQSTAKRKLLPISPSTIPTFTGEDICEDMLLANYLDS